MKVKLDTEMLTNMIVIDFEEGCNLVREGKMFVKDEGKVLSRVGGVKWRAVYFGKLSFFESDEQELSLRKIKNKKISSHPGEMCWRAFWRWEMLESKLSGWKEYGMVL